MNTEKILKTILIISAIWFTALSLVVWESPKQKYIITEDVIVNYETIEEDSFEEENPIVEKIIRRDIVTVTIYNPVTGQCNSSPLITADGSKIDLRELKNGNIKWIAVSRDLLKSGKVKYGDKIRIKCKEDPTLDGIYIVHDTMNSRWSMKIDILAHQNQRSTGKYSVVIEYLGEEG